jgi:hypothetical protein
MIAYDTLAFLGYEMGQPESGLHACSSALAIASLGARRFIAYYLMCRAQLEFATGDPFWRR